MLETNKCTLFLPGNVYGILPPSHARSASIILMLLHQCVAYGMFIMPGEVCVAHSCSLCCCTSALLQTPPCTGSEGEGVLP